MKRRTASPERKTTPKGSSGCALGEQLEASRADGQTGKPRTSGALEGGATGGI